jgi:hypothetical protein
MDRMGEQTFSGALQEDTMQPVMTYLAPRVIRRSQAAGLALGGASLLFSLPFLAMPLSTHHLSQLQALNRELGKLCANPPRQALNVCRLHARLLSAL